MADFTIREAVPDDAEGIIDYLCELADEPNNMISFDSASEITMTVEEEAETLQKSLDFDNSAFFVAVNNEGLIISLSNVTGGRRRGNRHVGYLGISIRQGWRDRGLGRTMMQHMIDWSRDTGVIRRIELEVFAHNPRALHLYEKVGFVIEGRKPKDFIKYGEYVDTIFMALQLFE
jgi:RimJ/RimL family protein N-acetyltransferase